MIRRQVQRAGNGHCKIMGCQPHWHWQAPGNQNAAPGRQEPNNLRHRPTTASACTACISRVDIRQGRQCQRGRARRPVRCSAVQCRLQTTLFIPARRVRATAPPRPIEPRSRVRGTGRAGRTRFRLPVYYSALHGASARLSCRCRPRDIGIRGHEFVYNRNRPFP